MSQTKYIIKDWVGNIIQPEKQFISFEEGWEYIFGELTGRLRLTDEDYQEYNVVPTKEIMNKRKPEELSEEQLQKKDCEENNLHNFEGEQTCNGCGVSYAEAHADDYDEGDR